MPASQNYRCGYGGSVGCNKSYRDPHTFSTEVFYGRLFKESRGKSGNANPGVIHTSFKYIDVVEKV